MRSMAKIATSVMLASFLCGAGGCDEAPSDPADPEGVGLRGEVKNAPALNGSALNGTALNGLALNGFTVNGFTVNGFTVNGFTVNGFTVNGSQLSAQQWVDGVPHTISGVGLIGGRLSIINGTNIYVLIFDDVRLDPHNPAGDVYLYDISVYDVINDTTAPLCTYNGEPTPAIPLVNQWDMQTGDRIDDPSIVTFACRGGALAKCVDWGYRPWATAERCDPVTQVCAPVSLREYHQACTRMVRADYCGDGTPHTVNGTLIDVYDPLNPGIQVEASAGHPLWGVEAEWGPDGATCAGSALRLQHLDELGLSYEDPPCLDELLEQEDCGDFPAGRPSLVGNSYCTAFGTAPESCD